MQHATPLTAQDQSLHFKDTGSRSRRFLRQVAVGLTLAFAAGMLAWGLSRLASDAPAAKRQVARIALLPDTPPPPPPPKEQRKDDPVPQARPQPRQEEAPKPQAANEPLKMEGAAGNGPSAFAAGAVTNDYRGGPVGPGGGASAPSVADRAAERLYANTVRQLLRDEIERRLPPESGALSANFSLWIEADGRIARWESDADTSALKIALDRSAENLRLPAPPAVAQPMRFRLTVQAGA